jgi:hypothetical protein
MSLIVPKITPVTKRQELAEERATTSMRHLDYATWHALIAGDTGRIAPVQSVPSVRHIHRAEGQAGASRGVERPAA